MKNRVARGGSEGDNDKAPSTSKFHFSKGKYGNVVSAWHGVLIQKAKANFPDICTQARAIFGVTDVGIGNDNQRAQNVNPEVRTRVGLDSEDESEDENNANDGDDEDRGNSNSKPEDDQISDIYYHRPGSDGNSDVDDGNGHNDDRNDAGPSHSENEVVRNFGYNHDVDAEESANGYVEPEETEEVDPSPSHGGHRDTKARGRK
jgi:hypothetical protein